MATLSDLQARLEQLKIARDSGALSVRKGDDSVTYRSLAEINATIAAIEAEIAAVSSVTPRVRTIRIHGKDGW